MAMANTAQPNAAKQQREFDMPLFAKWLRMLLVGFYSEEEIIVADFLLQRAASFQPKSIAAHFGLPEKQIRRILETRLSPDCIVERDMEGEGKDTLSFFRISRISIAHAAKRLQAVETHLMARPTDEYVCPAQESNQCQKSFNSLQAMGLMTKDTFKFMCPACSVELQTVSVDSASVLQKRLSDFRAHHQQLMLLTRDLAGLTAGAAEMPIPRFPKQALLVKRAAKLEAGNLAVANANSGKPADGDTSIPQGKMTGRRAGAADEQDVWFAKEVLDEVCAEVESASTSQETAENGSADSLEQASKRIQEELEGTYRHRRSVNPLGVSNLKLWQRRAEPTLMVLGEKRKLSEIRDREDVLDSMDDDDYQRWYNLERDFQRESEKRLIADKISQQRVLSAAFSQG